jgi:hypothetical protein
LLSPKRNRNEGLKLKGNKMKNLFYALLFAFAGVGSAFAQSYPNPILATNNVVATNAALLALSTTGMPAGSRVTENGYYAAGDMPSASYILSTSACSISGGDGGSQKVASPSGCWLLVPQTRLDPRIFGVTAGTDTYGTNAADIQKVLTYNSTLHTSGNVDHPVIDFAGLTYHWTGEITDAEAYSAVYNLHGVEDDSSTQTGVCPAMWRVTTSGAHVYSDDTFNSNFHPYTGFSMETNGTNQFNFIYSKQWEGSCGSVTATGTLTAGSNVIQMTSTAGLSTGMVLHNDQSIGIPLLSYIVYVGTLAGNPVVVINNNVLASGTQSINFYNDPDGFAYGLNGTNAGGSCYFCTSVEYGSGALNGDAYHTYGFSLAMLGNANDMQWVNADLENANADLFVGSGTGGIHLAGHTEMDNDAWNKASSTSSTIAGTTMVIGGTVAGPYQLGMYITGTGITGNPYITSVPAGGLAGTYTISQTETVSTAEAINANFGIVNPAAVAQADNGGAVYMADTGFGGADVQSFVEGSTNTPTIQIGFNYFATSSAATYTPSLVLVSTDQTNANYKNVTVDVNQSNIPLTWAYVTAIGTGTWNPTPINPVQGPVNFNGNINLFGTGALTGSLLAVNPVNTNYTALLVDAANDYRLSNNTANDTLTLPNNLPVGWWSKIDAGATSTYTNTIAAATGALLDGQAGGTVIIPAATPGEVRALSNATGTSASYSVNFQGFQQTSHTPTSPYTFQLSDCGNVVSASNGLTAQTYTVPQITLGNIQSCTIDFVMKGTATVTLVPGSGAAVNGSTSFTQPLNSGASYRLTTTDGTNWGLTGGGTVQGGELVGVQVLTSVSCSAGCTYTPDPGTAAVLVEQVGAGGGGGGAAVTSTSQSAIGMSGGAGSYIKVLLQSGFSGITVTDPAGGAGGAAGANGAVGGTATFGSIISCAGGALGTAGGVHAAATLGGTSGKAADCTSTAGTVIEKVSGGSSLSGIVLTPGTLAQTGPGGISPLGTPGNGQASATANGIAATGYGAGGSGGINASASEATATSGGNGSGAEDIIYEYSAL